MHRPEIRNMSASEKKLVKSLQQKKYRYLHRLYLVEGEKMIRELIRFHPYSIELLIYADESAAHNSDLRDAYSIRHLAIEEYNSISTLVTPQGIMAVVRMPEPENQKSISGKGWIIYLDALQDPGNAGTIIRTADWFGVRTIVFSKGCVDPYSPKVVQASMGSIFNTNIIETDIDTLKDTLPGIPFYAADLRGENLFNISFPENGVLCIGNEGNGLSDGVRNACDRMIFIPGDAHRMAESLNAGTATAIILSKIAN